MNTTVAKFENTIQAEEFLVFLNYMQRTYAKKFSVEGSKVISKPYLAKTHITEFFLLANAYKMSWIRTLAHENIKYLGKLPAVKLIGAHTDGIVPEFAAKEVAKEYFQDECTFQKTNDLYFVERSFWYSFGEWVEVPQIDKYAAFTSQSACYNEMLQKKYLK